MQISRRNLLAAAAPAALALAGCTATQVANFDAQWAAAQAWIAQQVQNLTKVLPTIESIASIAAGLFGPTYQAIVAAGSALANQIVSTIANVITAASPPVAPTPAASRKYGAMMHGAPMRTAIVGTTPPLPFALSGVAVMVVR